MRRDGFSLVELVLVTAIIAVLAAVAMPRYHNALSNYRAHAAARRLVADLELARASARAASTARTITFHVDGLGYDREDPQHRDAIDRHGTKVIETRLDQAPYHARLHAALPPITYNGYGEITVGSPGTITLRSGAATRTVRIDAAGKAVVR